ncbi:MAG: hypothetical protein MAG715_00774 [Methanonatronarchaeales archaeon]|nr:hypothetical protein [Methanonatronarchaeales archaeon]
MKGWDEELGEVREALSDLGWETLVEPYYVQGEETETLRRGDRYLHLAFGDVEDLPVEAVRNGGEGLNRR